MVSSRFLEFAWVEAQEVDPVGLLDPSLTLKPVQALLGHPTVFQEFADFGLGLLFHFRFNIGFGLLFHLIFGITISSSVNLIEQNVYDFIQGIQLYIHTIEQKMTS